MRILTLGEMAAVSGGGSLDSPGKSDAGYGGGSGTGRTGGSSGSSGSSGGSLGDYASEAVDHFGGIMGGLAGGLSEASVALLQEQLALLPVL